MKDKNSTNTFIYEPLKQKKSVSKIRLVLMSIFVLCLLTAFAPASFSQEVQNVKPATNVSKKSEMKINSDKLDYNPEKNEIVATGNAEVILDDQNSRLLADKITYNPDTQIIVAEKNVRLIKNGQVLKGDFTRINLQDESALVDKPNTKFEVVKIQAETANVYTDKIDALNGKAEIEEKLNLFLTSDNFGDYQRKETIKNEYLNKETTLSKKVGSTYRIQTNEIIIESGEEKNIITLKKSYVFIGKHKVAYMPSLVIKTDKAYSQIETQLPEIGTVRQIGMYIGPSKLFNLPGDATVKVSPIISMYNRVGAGGIARFKSETNKTEIGYASSLSKFVINGEQRLPKNFSLTYGLNSYVYDGFMGDKLPQYNLEVAHDRDFYVKDLDAYYQNRFAAGYVSDFDSGWGTSRFTWMGNLVKPIWTPKNQKVSLYINPQFVARAYGNGATTAVVRVGPYLETRFWDWYNRIGYYIAGVEGESPMPFDRYYYGKNSVFWMTEKKINRYLNIGYSTTLNLNKDNYDQRLLAENQLFMRVGPDDMKFRIGYDAVRQRSLFGLDLLVGSDRTSVNFDKLKVIDPSNLQKKTNQKPAEKASDKSDI